MSTDELRAAYDRAQRRLAHAQRELSRYRLQGDPDDPRFPRTLRKLTEDVEGAQRDVSYGERALQEAAGGFTFSTK
jgi:hypothetical protein